MARFAIKTLPLNISSMVQKVVNPMSIRAEMGEFEIEADSIEQARAMATSQVRSDEPHMICPWSEKTKCFTAGLGRNREFVHPTTLFKYDGKSFIESKGRCIRDLPKSGSFLSKEDAKSDYLKHKAIADKKMDAALAHLKAMNKLGVQIGYYMDGDTHGIYEDYMFLEVTEGPYQFTMRYES